jgi:hypothetical protein
MEVHAFAIPLFSVSQSHLFETKPILQAAEPNVAVWKALCCRLENPMLRAKKSMFSPHEELVAKV